MIWTLIGEELRELQCLNADDKLQVNMRGTRYESVVWKGSGLLLQLCAIKVAIVIIM